MQRLLPSTLPAVFFALAASSLLASPASALGLKLVSSGGTTVLIADNGPGDADARSGVITYVGAFDQFINVVATVTSKPFVGDALNAALSLSVMSSTGATGGTITVTGTDTGYGNAETGPTTITSYVGGTIFNGTTTAQAYVDTTNGAYVTAGPTVCSPGPQGPLGPGAFNSTVSGPCTLNGLFSGTMVVAATTGPNSQQSYGADLRVPVPAPPPPPIGCRFTGGGVDTNLNWNHVLEDGEMVRNGANAVPAGIDRYQFGGQVGAKTAQQPLPSGEWQHHQQNGPSGSFSFHGGTSSAPPGTRIVDVRCSDPGFCEPARPAPAKQLDFDGIGTFSNVGKGKSAPTWQTPNANVIVPPRRGPFTYHYFQVNIDDLGEPGSNNSGGENPSICPGRGFGEKSGGPFPDPTQLGQIVILPPTALASCECPDFYRITVYQGVLSTNVTYLPDGRIDINSLNRTHVLYEVYGYIDGGNLQIHPPTGYDSK